MSVEVMVESIIREVKEVIKSVEEQDLVRRLFTLDTSKTDTVKLPIFGGKEEEDFQRFKDQMEKAFDQNRVSRADQLSKLRESLRGQAKRMVPEDITEDIDKAWEALDKAYGDPDRLFPSTVSMQLLKLPGKREEKFKKCHKESYGTETGGTDVYYGCPL